MPVPSARSRRTHAHTRAVPSPVGWPVSRGRCCGLGDSFLFRMCSASQLQLLYTLPGAAVRITGGAHVPNKGVLLLAPCPRSEAALLPFASPAAVPDPGPLAACLAVNAWLLLAVSVALPLALLQLLEQRTHAAHAASQHDQLHRQQGQAARAAAAPDNAVAVAWPMRAYLRSSLVWCTVGLGMSLWQAVAPSGLPSVA